jgi:acetyl esterase/lipase
MYQPIGVRTNVLISRSIICWIFAVSALLAMFFLENGVTMAAEPDVDRLEFQHLTLRDRVRDIVRHPAFRGFGPLLLPWDDNSAYLDTPLANVGLLMPYHGHVRPDVVVRALNRMIDDVAAGLPVFHDFYDEQQKQESPGKRLTGLFFLRGKPGAPFALICPGGGFSYVGSLHEGFPLAVELSARGYNAFVLRYRVGSELWATEDLAAALAYVTKHAGRLSVGAGGYSLWGGSAGARMVGNIAQHGAARFGGVGVPPPGTVVIAYTGQSGISSTYPPTFMTVSSDDRIVSESVMDRRAEGLRRAGVPIEYRKYTNAGHGFGTGIGTDAEGWIGHAIRFWEKYISIGAP